MGVTSPPHTLGIRSTGLTAEHPPDKRTSACVCAFFQHMCHKQSHPNVHSARGRGQGGWMEDNKHVAEK